MKYSKENLMYAIKNIYIPSLCRIYQFSYDKYDDFSRPGNHNFLKLFLNIL